MITRLVTAFVIVAGLAAVALAQTTATTNMEILRQRIKADKKLVVAQNLQLTDAEGTAFWPVYDAYQKDLQQVNQRLTAVILAYANAYSKGPVGNDVAKKLLDEALAVDEAEAKLKSFVRAQGPCHAPGDEGGTLHPDREQDSGAYPLRAGRGHSARRREGGGTGA